MRVNGYHPAHAVRGGKGPNRHQRGRFATGHGVPEAGRIHWGRGGLLRAWVDCVKLGWRYR